MNATYNAAETNPNLRLIAFELAARTMEINPTTLPDILKNAGEIYQWLIKTN